MDSNVSYCYRHINYDYTKEQGVAIPIVVRQRILNDMIINLPKPMQTCVKALKKIQLETIKLEAEFYKEVHDLEAKYQDLAVPLNNKRLEIVTGLYKPTKEDADYPLELPERISEKICHIPDAILDHLALPVRVPKNTPGIPEFWLTIFKTNPILCEFVEPHDEPILKCLIDIRVACIKMPMMFCLEFIFTRNPYFKNTLLRKTYHLSCDLDSTCPFNFSGPEISYSTGTKIEWYKGRNVTVKHLTKTQRHKATGIIRKLIRTNNNNSFFNYFNPIDNDFENQELDDKTELLVKCDYQLGQYLRNSVIPKAVLYFTGEGFNQEYDSDNCSIYEESKTDDY